MGKNSSRPPKKGTEPPKLRARAVVPDDEDEAPLTRRVPSDILQLRLEDVTRTSLNRIRVPKAVGPRRASFMVLSGGHAGEILTVMGDQALIGRGKEVEIRMMGSGISRKHARITKKTNNHYVLEDLGSTNGTFVDGKRIEKADLKGGERVQVGPEIALRFGFNDETEENMARRLYEASTRDPLTQVYSRRFFEDRLMAELAYARRHRSQLSLIFFDLDHFKSINDKHGHAAGDAVLKNVARRVSEMLRLEDLFARYGGEEFVVLLRGIRPKNTALLAERIRVAVSEHPISFRGKNVVVTISAGVASLEECDDHANMQRLVTLADERAYTAKREGRNRVCAG